MNEKEIVDLETQFWSALRDGDAKAVAQLTADQCIVTGARGVGKLTNKQIAGMMEGAYWKLHSFAFTDIQVLEVRDDVAVIAYKVSEELTVEGKKLTLNASDASTWVKRNGRWVCVLHTESVEGDPFGRDRH